MQTNSVLKFLFLMLLIDIVQATHRILSNQPACYKLSFSESDFVKNVASLKISDSG